jgi:hypothetical protein
VPAGDAPWSPAPTQNALGLVDARLEKLESLIDRAFRLIHPGTRRELGGQLLLDPERIREYHEIRESLFQELRDLDELSQEVLPSSLDLDPRDPTERGSGPRQFRSQVAFLTNRLHDARVATLAEESFLEIKSAVVGMRRMLDQLRNRGFRQ